MPDTKNLLAIDVRILNEIGEYLAGRPYREVAGMLTRMQTAVPVDALIQKEQGADNGQVTG